MKEFLESCFPSVKGLKKEKLTGDGGHRSYIRVKTQQQSFILMSCGVKDPSLKIFIDTQKRLKNYVHVPQLFNYDLKKGLLLLEDLGDQSLELFYLKSGEKARLVFYKKALIQLIKMQDRVEVLKQDSVFDSSFFTEEIERAIYDIEKYRHDFLKQSSFNSNLMQGFKKEIQELLSDFQAEDSVYCHRDYHSRNLMLKDQKIFMIDFQDAGQGPWFYDLASLLYDCYIDLKQKKQLYQFYFENLSPSLKEKVKNLNRVQSMTELQFLQRGFKACGRFCAFKTENNKDTHLKYLKPTLTLLKTIAEDKKYKALGSYARSLIREL